MSKYTTDYNLVENVFLNQGGKTQKGWNIILQAQIIHKVLYKFILFRYPT